MHRFHLPPERSRGTTFSLTGREAQHALRVLRVRRGEPIMVLDGAGGELICEVRSCGRDTVELAVTRRTSVPRLPCQITLLQALPRGKIIEAIIQKATELGVHRVVPLLSERVTARLEGDSAAHKAEKLQQVAIEAIKQCGSAWLPRIESPMTPAEFLARKETFDLPLVASLQPGARHAREYFHTFQAEHGRKPESVCVWIGPEGDFTPDEVGAAQAAGALPITLGRLVLRSETAAIYCLSIVNHELHA
jgi:16S rRNA (uracil1498-N3)-methyltransferase